MNENDNIHCSNCPFLRRIPHSTSVMCTKYGNKTINRLNERLSECLKGDSPAVESKEEKKEKKENTSKVSVEDAVRLTFEADMKRYEELMKK